MGKGFLKKRQAGLFIFSLVLIILLLPGLGEAKDPQAGSGAETAGTPVISGIILQVNPPHPAAAKARQTARGLIDLFLSAGAPLSPDSLKETVRALEGTGLFDDVRVESDRDGDTTALLFVMTALPQIRKVEIDGNYPLFESDVRAVMTLSAGSAFREEDLAREAARVADLYRNEGFNEVRVDLETDREEDPLAVTLRVRIVKGPYDTLETLVFRGNDVLDEDRLKWRMKTWRMSLVPGMAGRFLPAELDEDLKALAAFYRGEGYADARLEGTVSRKGGPGEVAVEIDVREGDRYEVFFQGNASLSERVLRKEIAVFREGNAHDLGILRTVANIRDRYRSRGFLQARVDVESERVEEKNGALRRVTFRIDEGPRSTVLSVDIKGNEALSGETLRGEMLTRPPGLLGSGAFVPEVLNEDLSALRTLYAREGFLSAGIRDEVVWMKDRREVAVTVTIREGPRTVVADVSFEGLEPDMEAEVRDLLSLKGGMPFRESMVRDDEKAVGGAISRKGYPHVRVRGEAAFTEGGREARLVYRVEKGPLVTLDQVFLSGNFRTRGPLFRKTMNLEPGTVFTLEKVLDSQRDLRNLGIFDSVRFKTFGLAEKKEKAGLLVEVTERRPYYVESSLGYQSDKGFYGKLKAGDRNLFGLNKKLFVSGEVSDTSSRGEVGLTEPRLFGSSISATAVLFGERKTEYNQDFGTKSYGVSTGLTWPWSPRWTAGLGARLERKSRFFTGEAGLYDESPGEDPEEARDILTVTPSLNYDSRDSFLRPRKGVFSSVAMDVSKGITNSLDNFLKYRFDVRYYVTPWERLTFAFAGRGGYLEPFGSATSVPDDQLFYSGGAFTVRGYDENRLYYDSAGNGLGGRVSLMGSVEARIDLGRNFELDLFFDGGHLGQLREETDLPSFRSSAGLGLRYITPVGPIGILYGFKLDPRDGESMGRFHFAVGYTF